MVMLEVYQKIVKRSTKVVENEAIRMSGKNQLFQCPECGLHYRQQEIAKQCEEFCKAHNACSIEIMRHSIEIQPKAVSDED